MPGGSVLVRSRSMWLGIIALIYSVWNLIAWWITEPQEFGDTYRYFGSTLFDIQNPGITPVFVYTTIEDPRLVTLVQVIAYTITWLLLARVVFQRLAGTRIGPILAVSLLVISMTTPLWSWNTLLASESLSFSATTLWLAALIWATGPAAHHGTRVLARVASSAVLVITRPAMVVIVGAVVLIFGVWLWRRRSALVAGLAALLTFAPFGLYAVVRLQLLAGDETYRYRYSINNYVDKTSSFRAYADGNMPPCEPLVNAVNGPAPWDEVWVLKQELISRCPESFIWLRGSSASLLNWTLASPGNAISNFFDAIPRVTLQPYSVGRAMPDAISSILMPDWPVWILLIIYTVIGLTLAFVAGARLRITSLWILGAPSVLAASFLYLFAVWGSDGIEHNRHLLPLTAMLLIAVLTLPATLMTTNAGSRGARDKLYD
jgi:hypothetical protein